MWKKIKRGYQEFKEDDPGERFLKTYERWREHSTGPIATILIIVIGTVMIVAGFLLGLVPGVPGIVLGLLGAALIAARFRRMAVWLDWGEIKLREVWRKWRQA